MDQSIFFPMAKYYLLAMQVGAADVLLFQQVFILGFSFVKIAFKFSKCEFKNLSVSASITQNRLQM